MTNYEAVKKMNLNEMAKFLCGGDYACKNCAYEHNEKGCEELKGQYKEWLKKEKGA